MTFEITRQLSRNAAVYGTLRTPTGDLAAAGAAFEAPTLFELMSKSGEIALADGRRGGRGSVRRNRDPRMRELQEEIRAERARRRTPAEVLNERYGYLGLTFDGPMTDGAAQLMAEEKRAEILRNDILSRSPGSVGALTLQFGAGLLASMTDPIEVAAGFIPGVNVSRRISIGGAVLRGAGQGAAINAALEPFYGAAASQLQLDYTLTDALLNVGFGAVLGGGGAGIGRALVRRRQRRAERMGQIDAINAAAGEAEVARAGVPQEPVVAPVRVEGPDGAVRTVDTDARPPMPAEVEAASLRTREDALRLAIAQLANGRRVDVDAMFPVPRAGGQPRRPDSLLRFLSDRGLRLDEGGNLSALGADRWHRMRREPGEGRAPRRRLIRDGGRTLSQAAERAAEFGYIAESDENALLDAIAREMRGERVVARADEGAELEFAERLSNEQSAARMRDQFEQARLDAEASLAELAGRGGQDAPSPQQINALAMEMVEHGMSAQEVLDARANMLLAAQRASDPAGDILAPEETPNRMEDFDPFAADEWELAEMIEGYRAAGTLSESSEADLGEIANIEMTTAGYMDAARAAATCLAR